MQQSIVIGSVPKVHFTGFPTVIMQFEFIYYIHASIDFTATFQFVLQLFKNQKYRSPVFKKIPYVNILEVHMYYFPKQF